MAGLTASFIGGVVALQLSETPNERNARAESEFKTERSLDRTNVIEQQEYYLRVACEHSKVACDKAKEDIRRQNCQLYGEGCQRGGPNGQPASFDEELDKLIQERMRNPK